MSVIRVSNVRKYYGEVRAVNGIDFEVQVGEIFGFLGPNGAGKTTTVEMIEGYLSPDNGLVRVFGMDPIHDRYRIRERMGLMLQETALYPTLRVHELIRLFASYYQNPTDPEALLEMIGLQDKRHVQIQELSGGQRQRIVFILSLINDPELLILDEPTAGLDAHSRRAIWNWISRAREDGKTVFLTTHYIEEAEALCDRVAIIDHGQIITLDTPQQLILQANAEHRIEFSTDGDLSLSELQSLPGAIQSHKNGYNTYTLCTSQVEPCLKSLLGITHSQGQALRGLTVQSATLEDVFIELTGRRFRI